MSMEVPWSCKVCGCSGVIRMAEDEYSITIKSLMDTVSVVHRSLTTHPRCRMDDRLVYINVEITWVR